MDQATVRYNPTPGLFVGAPGVQRLSFSVALNRLTALPKQGTRLHSTEEA